MGIIVIALLGVGGCLAFGLVGLILLPIIGLFSVVEDKLVNKEGDDHE